MPEKQAHKNLTFTVTNRGLRSAGLKAGRLKLEVGADGRTRVVGGTGGDFFGASLATVAAADATVVSGSYTLQEFSRNTPEIRRTFAEPIRPLTFRVSFFPELAALLLFFGVLPGLYLLTPVSALLVEILLGLGLAASTGSAVYWLARLNRAQQQLRGLKKLATQEKWTELRSATDSLAEKRLGRFRHWVLLDVYQSLIPTILKDMRISADEQKVIEDFAELLDPKDRRLIELYYYNETVAWFLKDNFLDSFEEGLLKNYVEIFKLQQDDLRDSMEILRYYQAITAVRSAPLKPVDSASMPAGKCFLELPCRLMQREKSRGADYFVCVQEARLLLTDEKLHIKGTQDIELDLDDIVGITFETGLGLLSFQPLGRKKPLCVATADNLKVMTTLQKIRGDC